MQGCRGAGEQGSRGAGVQGSRGARCLGTPPSGIGLPRASYHARTPSCIGLRLRVRVTVTVAVTVRVTVTVTVRVVVKDMVRLWLRPSARAPSPLLHRRKLAKEA